MVTFYQFRPVSLWMLSLLFMGAASSCTWAIPGDADGDGLPDAWETQYHVTTGPYGNPAQDGISNLMKYALGLDPNKNGTASLPYSTLDIDSTTGKKYLNFHYRRLINDTGLTYNIELSLDLQNWTTDESTVEEVVPRMPTGDGITNMVTVRLKTPLGTAGLTKAFMRLNISDTANGSKIPLNASMLINEGGIGDASLLVDEQAISGDPVNAPPGGNPVTQYFAGWGSPGSWAFPVNVTIDLGTTYQLTNICIYDSNGVANVTVSSGTPFHWTPLFTDPQSNYNSWNKHPVAVTTRFVQVSIASAGAIPNEILLYGFQVGKMPGAPVSTTVVSPTIENFMGVNMFINDSIFHMGAFGFLREYSDWEYFEGHNEVGYPGYPNNQNGFAPAWTGDNWDQFYSNVNTAGLQLSPAINNSVAWLNGGDTSLSQNKPILINSEQDPLQSSSYIEHADHMFQRAARYGSHAVADNLLKLRSDNALLTGLNEIHYFENWNEHDKWWAGRDAYFTPYEYAAMSSADDDADQGRMPATVGIKNADPTAKLVMSGLANPSLDYIKALKFWCDYNRGGSFAWNVINVHHYSNDGGAQFSSTTGISPEADDFKTKMLAIRQWRDLYLPGVEFWVSEFGYDTNSASPQGCPAIGTFDSQEVQGQWLVRSYLALAAAGVDRAMMYLLKDINTGSGVYATSGVIDTNNSPKTSWWYVYTLKNRLTGLRFDAEQSSGNANVTIYRFKDANSVVKAYVLWCPTANQTTVNNYKLTLQGAPATADLVTLTIGSIGGTRSALTIDNGQVTVNVSERPIFVLPDNTAPDPVLSSKIVLTPSMVTNESGSGDAGQMVDEQATAGDPRQGTSGAPGTVWSPGGNNASAYIDLGRVYQLDEIYIYDVNSIGDLTVQIGSPGAWTTLFVDPLNTYLTWREHVVKTSTRYIRFTRANGGSNFSEVVLYGK